MKLETYKGKDDVRAVFLHGFPGVRSKQNRELAEAAATATGRRADVLLYSGLGCAPGEFGFRKCIDDVERYFAEFLSRTSGRNLDLVGHSWGGYLALRIAGRYPDRVRKLVLLSPLLVFPPESPVLEGLKGYASENPALELGDLVARAREFSVLGSEGSPLDWAAKVSPETEVLFLQAAGDEITPGAHAEAARGRFRRAPVFEIFATDHSFVENRPAVKARIGEFLAD